MSYKYNVYLHRPPLCKKITIHHVTIPATSKNVIPGHNHLLTTSNDNPSLTGTWVIIKVNRTFLEVASMVVTLWIVASVAHKILSFCCTHDSIVRCRDYLRYSQLSFTQLTDSQEKFSSNSHRVFAPNFDKSHRKYTWLNSFCNCLSTSRFIWPPDHKQYISCP